MLLRRERYTVLDAEADDAADMAAVHGASFAQGWTDDDLAKMMARDTNIALVARAVGKPGTPLVGMVLAQIVADEAEILTVAVSRRVRSRGVGRLLMDAVLRELYARRVAKLNLEVDETNGPARALYDHLGFRQVGERRGYTKVARARSSFSSTCHVELEP